MTHPSGSSPWFAYVRPKPRARVRLFCVPYAGGGASIFRAWAQQAPDTVEVIPVALPGREGRFREPLFTQLAPLIGALSSALLPHTQQPWALFGHSMGALISFELARQLRRAGAPAPAQLFLSGFHAPQNPDPAAPIHDLPGPEFLDAIRAMNGTPDEVLQNAELVQLIEPILRADFQVYEDYQYHPEAPLACPITVFSGMEDPQAAPAHMQPWREQTGAAFALHAMPGDHFFLHTAWATMLDTIVADLGRVT